MIVSQTGGKVARILFLFRPLPISFPFQTSKETPGRFGGRHSDPRHYSGRQKRASLDSLAWDDLLGNILYY